MKAISNAAVHVIRPCGQSLKLLALQMRQNNIRDFNCRTNIYFKIDCCRKLLAASVRHGDQTLLPIHRNRTIACPFFDSSIQYSVSVLPEIAH